MKSLRNMSIVLCSLAAFVGCASPNTGTVGPYSADQWREATKPGQAIRYRVEIPSASDRWEREIVVSAVDDLGVSLESSIFIEDGMPSLDIAPSTTDVSWSDLVAKTRFPVAKTSVRPAYIETDAGRFHARIFEVTERLGAGQKKITRTWFSDSLVGAPLRHEIEVGGRIVSRLVLVSHSSL